MFRTAKIHPCAPMKPAGVQCAEHNSSSASGLCTSSCRINIESSLAHDGGTLELAAAVVYLASVSLWTPDASKLRHRQFDLGISNGTLHWPVSQVPAHSRAQHIAMAAKTYEDYQIFLNSTTFDLPDDLDLLYHCWRLINCESCLATDYPCSWCSISSTCVPNTIYNFPFQILAPIKDENICPLGWRERWELRAKPFSCRCSTMTLMSVVIAVPCTLAVVVVLQILTVILRWAIRRWRKRQPGWWKLHEWRPSMPHWTASRRQVDSSEEQRDEERQPLLNS